MFLTPVLPRPIGRISRSNWGLRYNDLIKIYYGIGESILLYGAVAWAHRMELTTYAARMIRAQRLMLLMICKGYRTLSADALQIMAGIMPIDLRARYRKEIYWNKRNELGNEAEIKARYLEMWQDRWDVCEKGRPVYGIWPNVTERLEITADITHYVTQYMTGHGNFAAYLHRFHKRESPLCNLCQIDDTPDHVWYDCPRYNEERMELAAALGEIGMVYYIREALNTAEGFEIVKKWTQRIGRLREDEIIG